MDVMEGYARAKVVKALVESADKLTEALSAAQLAKDEPLFGRIFKKQTELWDMASSLMKEKQNGAS